MKLKSSMKINEVINRRHFAQRAATAAALVLLPVTDLEARPEPAPARPDQAGKPDDLSAADWEEVQARHQNLVRVYGGRLSADEKVRALHILTAHQQMLASIRLFSVQNGDPSACTLRLAR